MVATQTPLPPLAFYLPPFVTYNTGADDFFFSPENDSQTRTLQSNEVETGARESLSAVIKSH